MTSGAGTVVSNLDLMLTANTVFNIGAGGFTQNYFVSDGGGGFSLNKTGAGTLTLGAPNTYTGGTTVNSGTLALARGGGAGAIRGVVTVNSGATLNLTVNNALGYNAGQQVTTLNINGGTVSVTGNQGDEGYLTSFNLTGSTLAYASTNGSAYQISAGDATAPGITSNASATTSVISGGVEIRSGNLGFNVASGTTASGVDLLVSGAITVPGNTTYGITKTGTGVMVLSGANTYTGNVLINGGTLAVGHFGADNGTNGAVGNATVAGRTVTVNSGATLNGTAQNWFGNASNADANLPAIIVNGGTLSTIRYTTIGSLTLNGATVTNSATDSGNYQGFALRGGVTVVTAASTISAAAATATTQGYHLGANTTFNVGSTGASGADLTVSAPLRNQSGDFGSAAGGFTKSGAGTMLLSGANTYTGATTVIQGTLTVAGTGAALGTGALAVNNANTGAGTNVIVNFNTNSNQTVNGLSSTIAKPTSGTNTAQVNIASGSTLTDTQSGTTSYAGSVSGGGTLAIGGQNSAAPATVNYTGTDTAAQTNVNANATLQLNNAAARPSPAPWRLRLAAPCCSEATTKSPLRHPEQPAPQTLPLTEARSTLTATATGSRMAARTPLKPPSLPAWARSRWQAGHPPWTSGRAAPTTSSPLPTAFPLCNREPARSISSTTPAARTPCTSAPLKTSHKPNSAGLPLAAISPPFSSAMAWSPPRSHPSTPRLRLAFWGWAH